MPRPQIATRERILKAAYERFAHYGFRRTSMEDIAAEAGVSRAALYLQFRNKEEIFRSLSEELHRQALAQAAEVLEGNEPLTERLIAAVEAKSLRFVEIAYGSPHGNELLDESNRICGKHAMESEQSFRQQLTKIFRRAAQAGEINLAGADLTAAETADLLARGISGLKGPGVGVDVYRQRLAALVRVFVIGIGGKAGTKAKRRATVTAPTRRSTR